MNREDFFKWDYEPFCILEGGLGLNDIENDLRKKLNKANAQLWVIEDLYDNPQRIGALQFLKPKTLIFGTTGIYHNKLDTLFKMADALNLDSVERVYLTLDSYDSIGGRLKEFGKKYPKIQFFDVDTLFDDEDSIRKVGVFKI